ncbi:MAG: nitroreductase family protein [Chloroflexi bacterium]|nr:nitroreductase family protein [Chloroflexota bacterium]
MDFSELVKKRYSVRAYRRDPVPDEKLQQILEAVRLAPTAANRQPFRLIVAHTAGREAEIGRIYGRPWFVQAPLVMCLCGIRSQSWVRRDGRIYMDIDIGIVMDHLVLAATDLGLGTCWVGAIDVLAAREVLSLPDDAEPIVCSPLGYPDDLPREKKRKSLTELVQYERWQALAADENVRKNSP